jgi:Ca2+-binding EF-hand superfamily protein
MSILSQSAFVFKGLSDEAFLSTLNRIKEIVQSADKIKAWIKGSVQRKKYHQTIFEIESRPNTLQDKTSNESILKNILDSVKIRKLNLEQCFRAADTDSDGKISHKELKNFINSLELSIPNSYITKFLLILDEDCSGTITKEEYYNTLSAYQVSKESHSASGRLFNHEALINFCEALNKKEIEPEQIFNMCDVNTDGKINLKELEKAVNIFKLEFKQKEIAALMNLLDSNADGEISREEFLRCMDIGRRGKGDTRKTIESKKTVCDVFSVVYKLESDGNTLYDLLDLFKDNISAEVFARVVKSFSSDLTDPEISVLIQEIFKNQQKTVRKADIEEFCLGYTQSNMLSKSQYLKKLELSLEKLRITMESILNKEHIKGTIERSSFSMILKKYFNFNERQITRFISLCDVQGFITIESFINLIDSASPLQVFGRILEENQLSLDEFFDRADKHKTGKISTNDFELAAVIELKNVEGKLLTDLSLAFPVQKIDKKTFLKVFEYKKPEPVVSTPVKPLNQIQTTTEIIIYPTAPLKLIEKVPKTPVKSKNKLETLGFINIFPQKSLNSIEIETKADKTKKPLKKTNSPNASRSKDNINRSGDQVLYNIMDRYSINLQAPEFFKDIECEVIIKKNKFIDIMQDYCTRPECNSIYEFVYGEQENKPIYYFFTYFDYVLACYQSKLPEIITPKSSLSPADSSYFRNLSQAISGPLETYGLSLGLENTDLGFARVFEKCFNVPKDESLGTLKTLNIAKSHRIRLYHIMTLIDACALSASSEVVLIPSARTSRANIREAKLKLKNYIEGDNPKKRQLTSQEVFGILDKNKDGQITSEEFLSCLDMIKLNLTANEKILLTREVDKNRDDKINYEEIMDFLDINQSDESGFSPNKSSREKAK